MKALFIAALLGVAAAPLPASAGVILKVTPGNNAMAHKAPAPARRKPALHHSPYRTEAMLHLDYRQRRDIQRMLWHLGFNPHGIDGVFGRGTRRAIRAWQHRNRLVPTGYLDVRQLVLLRSQGQRSPSRSRMPGSRTPARH